jgi:hypothetical protein
MKNLLVVPLSEESKKEFIKKLNRLLISGCILLTIAHKREIDDVIYIMDDDGDVNHLNDGVHKSSPTEPIQSCIVTEHFLSFTFNGEDIQIPFAGLQVHCEAKQIITQSQNDPDVYVFEKQPTDAERRQGMLSVEAGT